MRRADHGRTSRPQPRGTRALLLVGHGSATDDDSAAPVYAHADRIARKGSFDQVCAAFWKEPPFLRDGLGLVDADDVFVVPVFLADGYYTREVIPRELRLAGSVTRRGAQVIRYCAPVGAHPRMPELVLRRAREAARSTVAERRETALVVIGHGTDRSPTSADTVHRVAARVRARSEFASVAAGFLDEDPRIRHVVETVDARRVVLVPYFLAEGYHTRETIPRVLGLDGDRTQRDGRTLYYGRPVGTMPEVADVIVRLAKRAG